MSGVVFLTGANGFLGTWVARWILRETDHAIVALVRADDDELAARRLLREWWDWPELVAAIGQRVRVVHGDVVEQRLGLDDATYADLARQVTHVVHMAADFRIDAPLDKLHRTNLLGTANALELARAVNRDHGLERFSHVSTAYVAGLREGAVPEEALTDEYGFASAYEETKYQAECLVQRAREELPVSVFRPGLIVGDSQTGAIRTFNTLYVPLRWYLAGHLRVVPSSPTLRVNLVPVDYVASAVGKLTFDGRAVGQTFHLTAPSEALPTVDELLQFARGWAAEHLGVRLPRPVYLPASPRAIRWGCRALRALSTLRGDRGGTLRALDSLAPYFAERREYRRDNVDRLLGPYDHRWSDLLPRLLEYAVYHGFLHRSERTVHEQVLFRLQSRSRPVTYHDVVEGKVVDRSAADVRREILAAAAALRSLGIAPGDRVAIAGLNSTRYLALDVAIGLLGGISVPIYYTCPPADVDRILASSGSRLLLVGTPALLARLGELSSPVPVVSFCRGPLPKSVPRPVISWGELLELGHSSSATNGAPVSPGDLAMLLYTSGTTGHPKGVVFRHGQIRWMAESLASVLPWPARNAPASYLSFLPRSHVVEGILASYAPYYLPAPIDVYFLEDFKELQRTLPLVRPTIFFSVPRLYEKLHEAVRESRIGRYCISGPDDLLGRALRPVMRWLLLRRAGLDRSAQLMVGSGPSREDVLRDLRKIGVEVHNAYGLTEAPLVTLNRLGRNRLGTVGELLPETEVRIADDGEVMVRGPQVTPGYFDEGVQQPFREGWLLTGDLGYLTEDGSLVLSGRKKELIATSYGKKISPAKVEALLRAIPGVAEAMLVGDGRPYCGALLWIRDGASGHPGSSWAEAVDRALARVNASLSHPEQVKSWAVLRDDLSIEAGDLTANLKLRRSAVASRLRGVVDALYGGPIPGTILHLGRAERGELERVPFEPPTTPPAGLESGERQLAGPVGVR